MDGFHNYISANLHLLARCFAVNPLKPTQIVRTVEIVPKAMGLQVTGKAVASTKEGEVKCKEDTRAVATVRISMVMAVVGTISLVWYIMVLE